MAPPSRGDTLNAGSAPKAGSVLVWHALLSVLECVCIGASPSGKAAAFGAAIRRFESFRPSSFVLSVSVNGRAER